MNNVAYTLDQVTEGGRFYEVVEGAQPDKRLFAKAIAEAFINGMTTQERLTAQPPAERPGA